MTPSHVLIEAHLEACQAGGLSEKTIADRRKVLHRVDAALPYGLVAAASEELVRWLAQLADAGRSVKTLATYFSHIRPFYAWAFTAGALEGWNPTLTIAAPRVPKHLPRPATEDQLTKVLDQADHPLRTMVMLAAYAGLRAGEIAALRREDVTPAGITVRGKGGRDRWLPLHPLIWAEVGPMPPGPVVEVCGHPATSKRISHWASEQLHLLGHDLTLHRFRHRFATQLLRPSELGGAGADLRTVQELMGHASVATTQVYTQVTDDQLRLAVDRLP